VSAWRVSACRREEKRVGVGRTYRRVGEGRVGVAEKRIGVGHIGVFRSCFRQPGSQIDYDNEHD
jgi:hypothetical protein